MGHKHKITLQTPVVPETPIVEEAEVVEAEEAIVEAEEFSPEYKKLVAQLEKEKESEEALEAKGGEIEDPVELAISQIPDEEMKQKALESYRKTKREAVRNVAAKAFAAFNEECGTALPELILQLAKKHSADLTGRKLIISFPSADKHLFSNIVAKGGNGGGGSRAGGNGFRKVFTTETGEKLAYQSVSFEGASYTSLNALATAKGWKYNGRANGTQAVTVLQNQDGEAIGKNTAELKDGVVVITEA